MYDSDREMRRIYEESIKAKDYLGSVYSNTNAKTLNKKDVFKLDVLDKNRQFDKPNNTVIQMDEKQKAIIIPILKLIAFIIFATIFIGIPLLVGS